MSKARVGVMDQADAGTLRFGRGRRAVAGQMLPFLYWCLSSKAGEPFLRLSGGGVPFVIAKGTKKVYVVLQGDW